MLEEKRRRQLVKNPLEPLLKKLAKEFVDDTDLSNKLRHLYVVGFTCLLCVMPASASPWDSLKEAAHMHIHTHTHTFISLKLILIFVAPRI